MDRALGLKWKGTPLINFQKFFHPTRSYLSLPIYFQENFLPFCLFTYTNDFFSTLPAVSRAYLLIKFEEKFQPTLLLEPLLVLDN